jgi:hypothetical protein
MLLLLAPLQGLGCRTALHTLLAADHRRVGRQGRLLQPGPRQGPGRCCCRSTAALLAEAAEHLESTIHTHGHTL